MLVTPGSERVNDLNWVSSCYFKVFIGSKWTLGNLILI